MHVRIRVIAFSISMCLLWLLLFKYTLFASSEQFCDKRLVAVDSIHDIGDHVACVVIAGLASVGLGSLIGIRPVIYDKWSLSSY